jgi:hypothetical protein
MVITDVMMPVEWYAVAQEGFIPVVLSSIQHACLPASPLVSLLAWLID